MVSKLAATAEAIPEGAMAESALKNISECTAAVEKANTILGMIRRENRKQSHTYYAVIIGRPCFPACLSPCPIAKEKKAEMEKVQGGGSLPNDQRKYGSVGNSWCFLALRGCIIEAYRLMSSAERSEWGEITHCLSIDKNARLIQRD